MTDQTDDRPKGARVQSVLYVNIQHALTKGTVRWAIPRKHAATIGRQ